MFHVRSPPKDKLSTKRSYWHFMNYLIGDERGDIVEKAAEAKERMVTF